MKGAGRVQEPCRQTEILREARGKRNESKSAREGGERTSLGKRQKDGSVEAGKSERSEDITTIEKCVCVCVFALLQWPHLPHHPVKKAQ